MATATNNAGHLIHWNWTTDVWNSAWIGGEDEYGRTEYALSNFAKTHSTLFSEIDRAWQNGDSDLLLAPLVVIGTEVYFLASLIERVLIAVATVFTAAVESVRNLAYLGLNACGFEPSAADDGLDNPLIIS